MERLKKLLNKVLFPKLTVVIVIVPVAFALLGYTFWSGKDNSPVTYISYVLSTYALTVICAWMTRIPKERIMAALHRNKYIHRYLTDIPFKTQVSLHLSLGFNLLFMAIKLFYGIRYRSIWFGTLTVYYVMLAGMRFLLLRHISQSGIGKDLVSEWKHYRLCGMILLLMNAALLGIAVLVVQDNNAFYYKGYLIYIVAMYDFYNITVAIRNIIRYWADKSAVMSASRAIKLAAALVSMLSLETAMLTQFDEETDPQMWGLMTGLTGGCVCLFVFIMAIFMLVRSAKQIKQLNNNNMEMGELS